jgi:cyclopropane fatty-acyl-phospholipid synthase-like methyltransferase
MRVDGQSSMTEKPHASIVRFAEQCLDQHGDSFRGVGWTRSQEQTDRRYRVMLGLLAPTEGQPVTLLDFGCGASHLYEYIRRHCRDDILYSGLDVSARFLELSRRKFPELTYYDVDVLDGYGELPHFDYIVMNGIFTVRSALSVQAMTEYFEALVARVWARARRGIAFNVMSKYVDWERDDLFHVPMETLAGFLTRHVSRHFVLRHDYGLYEYTAYVYRDPIDAGELP